MSILISRHLHFTCLRRRGSEQFSESGIKKADGLKVHCTHLGTICSNNNTAWFRKSHSKFMRVCSFYIWLPGVCQNTFWKRVLLARYKWVFSVAFLLPDSLVPTSLDSTFKFLSLSINLELKRLLLEFFSARNERRWGNKSRSYLIQI